MITFAVAKVFLCLVRNAGIGISVSGLRETLRNERFCGSTRTAPEVRPTSAL